MERESIHDIMPEIKARWSPHAFSEDKIDEKDLYAILEAASFAPSCYNEQPWRFVVGYDSDSLEKLRNSLMPLNLRWAKKAPILILVLSKKNFTLTGQPNFWSMFDTGTAWGLLAIEALRRGIMTHGMAGFNKKKVVKAFDIPDEYEPIMMFAMGRYGDPSLLDDDLKEREHPDPRKDVSELILNK